MNEGKYRRKAKIGEKEANSKEEKKRLWVVGDNEGQRKGLGREKEVKKLSIRKRCRKWVKSVYNLAGDQDERLTGTWHELNLAFALRQAMWAKRGPS